MIGSAKSNSDPHALATAGDEQQTIGRRSELAKAKQRERSKRWYRKNRETVLVKVARKKGIDRSCIPIRQRRRFRRNPNRERQLGIRNYVVCRECGAKLRRLHGGPSPHVPTHGLTPAGYRRKWPDAPLICEWLRRELSQRSKLQMESRYGHADEPPIKKWQIVCAIVQGKTYEEIGQQLNRATMTIWSAARALGLRDESRRHARRAFYDFGEAVTAEAIRTLRHITGQSVPQFAKGTGLNASAITEAMRQRHKGIQSGTAKKIIVWRDDLIRHLLMTAPVPARGQDRYSGSRILKTFFPNLRLKRDLLLRVMRWCRRSASVTPTMNANELGEQFCAQAMLEARQGSHERLFVRFLPWAPDLIGFFQANLPQLKGHGNLWPLADAVIVQRWDTTPHVLSSAWRARSIEIPPDEMRRLISEAQTFQLAASAGSARSKQRVVMPDDQKQFFIVGRQVSEAVTTFDKLIATRRALPKRKRQRRDLVRAALKTAGYTEAQIDAGVSAKTALIAARAFVSAETNLQASVVAKYHRQYLVTVPLV
jgi:hypothetical protein